MKKLITALFLSVFLIGCGAEALLLGATALGLKLFGVSADPPATFAKMEERMDKRVFNHLDLPLDLLKGLEVHFYVELEQYGGQYKDGTGQIHIESYEDTLDDYGQYLSEYLVEMGVPYSEEFLKTIYARATEAYSKNEEVDFNGEPGNN